MKDIFINIILKLASVALTGIYFTDSYFRSQLAEEVIERQEAQGHISIFARVEYFGPWIQFGCVYIFFTLIFAYTKQIINFFKGVLNS